MLISDVEINNFFKIYSDNIARILDYLKYRKELHEYCDKGYPVYRMIPFMKESIDLSLSIYIFGFFDKNHGLSLRKFLDLLRGPSFDSNDINALKKELAEFEKENESAIKSLIRIRHKVAHVNPKDDPKSISIQEVENIIGWIEIYINKLHVLCNKSNFGYSYSNDNIFYDVLDVLKKEAKLK